MCVVSRPYRSQKRHFFVDSGLRRRFNVARQRTHAKCDYRQQRRTHRVAAFHTSAISRWLVHNLHDWRLMCLVDFDGHRERWIGMNKICLLLGGGHGWRCLVLEVNRGFSFADPISFSCLFAPNLVICAVPNRCRAQPQTDQHENKDMQRTPPYPPPLPHLWDEGAPASRVFFFE